jgi:hypothetical protein
MATVKIVTANLADIPLPLMQGLDNGPGAVGFAWLAPK